jgi:hypothetical protein
MGIGFATASAQKVPTIIDQLVILSSSHVGVEQLDPFKYVWHLPRTRKHKRGIGK